MALWEQWGFLRTGQTAEEDQQPKRAVHKLDSFLLNVPLVPWAMRERPYLAPGRSPAALGSDHGPVVLRILGSGCQGEDNKAGLLAH